MSKLPPITVRWSVEATKRLRSMPKVRETAFRNAVERFRVAPTAVGRGYKVFRAGGDTRLRQLRAGRGDRVLLLVEGSTASVEFIGNHDQVEIWASRHQARLRAAVSHMKPTTSARAARWKATGRV